MMALIDSDVLVYRIGFACQKTRYRVASIDLGTDKKAAVAEAEKHGFSKEEMETQLEVDPIEHCLHSVKVAMESIIAETKATSYRAFLTGSNNFREKLVDYYKMNRKDAQKPYYYKQIRDYLTEHWNAEVNEDQEADDALSIAQYNAKEDTVICTIDKDLKNTPGWNYNFVKKEMEYINGAQADLNFYVQLITGDMTDNIPGFYQITGTRNSMKLKEPLAYIEHLENMWLYVVGVYVDEFRKWTDSDEGIQEAVEAKLKETGILLWMRRTEGEIWSPPL